MSHLRKFPEASKEYMKFMGTCLVKYFRMLKTNQPEPQRFSINSINLLK
jgi:hypothetical protein